MQKDFSTPPDSVEWYVDPTLKPLPIRSDLFLKKKLLTRSRTQIQGLFKKKRVLVNTKPVAASFKLRGGETLCVLLDPDREVVDSADIELNILHEDDDFLAVSKPPNMVMHPAGSVTSGTLLNAVHYYYENMGSEVRPSLLQRLDKHTSGLVVLPKNEKAHQTLQQQIVEHSNDKVYLAICDGIPEKKEGFIEADLGKVEHPFVKKMGVYKEGTGGKYAKTGYTVLMKADGYALLGVKLYTGRQHQIRVHMAHIGHPLTGDGLYEGSDSLNRQALHSYYTCFKQPSSGNPCELLAPLPHDMTLFLQDTSLNWQLCSEKLDLSHIPTLWNPRSWLDSFKA